MNKINKCASQSLAVALSLTMAIGAHAAENASRLGSDLTPSGAETSGNKNGSIPAWSGKETLAANWAYGQNRGQAWKYKGEKPLFSIDASNVDKYEDRLTPGQVATIKQVKGYRMDVYPSHRNCGVPDFVADNTRKNIGFARLGDDGWSMKEAYVPGYPFPMPTTGAQAMWNAKLRYRGIAMEYRNSISALSPRKGSDDWIKASNEQTNFYPWGAKGSQLLSQLPNVESYLYLTYSTPTAIAGQAFMLTSFLDRPGSETFYYFPGQRRVRRMPSYAYDAPVIGFENQYAVDEPNVFQGTMDRFDWKLLGKKEVYVPYNVFGVYDFDKKFEDIAQQEFVNPAHRRYELHRVWVIEATVKPGTRHSSPKRTYFLDEDSWNFLAADDYDAQGKLWKHREGYLIPVYETGTCDVSGFAQYNLNDSRYIFDMHAAGTGKDIQWIAEGKSPRYKSSFYTADNLRAISDR